MIRSMFYLTFVFMLALSFGINAQGRGPGGGKFFEKLNLTDAQKDKIEDIRLSHQKQVIDLKANLEKEMLSMKELLQKDGMTRSEYNAQHDRIAAARDKMQKARSNHQMDVYDQLNAEQKKLWRQFHARGGNDGANRFFRQGRGSGKRGPGNGPGGCWNCPLD